MRRPPSQADRLWDPPLLRPQHGGPRGPGDHHVPQLLCRLLHHGWHRCGVLHGPVPSGGPDGSARRPPHVYDHHSPGVAAAAGPAQLSVLNARTATDFSLRCIYCLVTLCVAFF